ncbi:hypothetical protein D3C77_805330 [compost metagenome]
MTESMTAWPVSRKVPRPKDGMLMDLLLLLERGERNRGGTLGTFVWQQCAGLAGID